MLLSFTQLRKKYSMNIKGIIHVGAHYGEEIGEYVNNGIQEIILFEPLSECFDILQRKIFDLNANIEGYQVALGSSPGIAEMYISDNQMQSSSILKPKVHLTHHPHVKFNGTEEVEVDMLDNFDTKDYNFLNMDVQGYELEVLKGGTETLKHVDYVYCEVNRDELYEGNAYIQDIDDFLSKYDMIRVETNWEGDLWGDALYIKKK
jgi:FkbM family methyltransferase